MAVKSNDTQRAEQLATLTDEAVKSLENIRGELDRAEANLDALEELGLDVSRLRERVAWGRKAREVILKQFGSK